MRRYQVELVGKTPLLLHADDIEWADTMEDWKNNPKNKKTSKAGDDRSPAWRWIGYLYHDGEHVSIPQDNIMRSIMEGGAMIPVPGGRGTKTFKSQTQSGMMSAQPFWNLRTAGEMIAVNTVHALMQNEDFRAHREAAQQLGFDLHVKRAKIATSKHIRVRPIFREWSASGELIVTDDQITQQILLDILTYAGQYKGLGDWRPGGKTPGPYGMFSASLNKA